MLQVIFQVSQGNGPVLPVALNHTAVYIKQSVVDLASAGVHDGTDKTFVNAQTFSHGFQGGHAVAGDFLTPGIALGGGDTDADAGERAGAFGNGHSLNILGGFAALLQYIFCHDHQGLAVGEAGVLVAFTQELRALH